jgi:hypothetical protein
LLCILRGLKCSLPVALGLVSVVVLNELGLAACTTIRGDLLAVVLQLAALQVAFGGTTWRRAVVAALLCTLALLTKLNAGWAGLALLGYYFVRRRPLTFVFGLAWVASAAGSILLLDLLAGGRMLANLRALSAPGLLSVALLVAPLMFLHKVGQAGLLLALALPFAVGECVVAFRQRRATAYHFALPCCLLLTVPLFADKGVVGNHLLDLLVLTIPLLGYLWQRLPSPAEGRPVLRPLLALGLGWVLCMAWSAVMAGPVLEVVRSFREGTGLYPARPLAGLVGDNEPILSEDPWISITRNELPVILDPCSVARFGSSRPELVEPLKERLRKREFHWLVLCYEIGDRRYYNRHHWDEIEFGPLLVRVMGENYRFHSKRGNMFIYAPRHPPAEMAAGPDGPPLTPATRPVHEPGSGVRFDPDFAASASERGRAR